jgi:hypothetical protein
VPFAVIRGFNLNLLFPIQMRHFIGSALAVHTELCDNS